MFINESFLSFVWQNLYFNSPNLKTTNGEPIRVIHRGYLNRDAGPDFLEAKIRIGEITWAGDVELHVNASDWHLHKHLKDISYNRVILHVVYKNDGSDKARRYDGSQMPTLEVGNYIDKQLIFDFHNLIHNIKPVPCASELNSLPRIKLISMIDKALIERLEKKAEIVFKLLHEEDNDWDIVTYRLLMKNFGFKVNQANMLLLSKVVPYHLVLRMRNSINQLESLFFGMAGFLESQDDHYQLQLYDEFRYIIKKYNLTSGVLKRYNWKFLRMHPQNFPTIRISQLISVLMAKSNFFSYILDEVSIKSIVREMSIKQSAYWQKHYDFGKESNSEIAGLGNSSIENIIINTFTPILTAYSKMVDNQIYLDKAIHFLENINAENNRITKIWERLTIKAMNASESQGLIELYNNYCLKKKCLTCNIGTSILLESSK